MRRVGDVKQCQVRAIIHPVLSACLLAGVLLAGCATPQPMTVEEQVGNRALQWADALMALDYDEALTFMTPTYQSSPRAARFRGDFSGAGFWQDAEIKWIKCEDQSDPPAAASDLKEAGNADPSSKTTGSGDGDECVLNTWDDCGQATASPFSASSTASASSERCEVRLMLLVMKPPEMSFPMPIPYELTWLKIDGVWYIYRK